MADPTENANEIKRDENCIGVRMRIKWDFPGREDRDLELKAEDEVELISRLDEDWCYGETSDGRQGYFPFVYAEVIHSDTSTGSGGPNRPVPPPKAVRSDADGSESDELQGRPTGDKELNPRNRIVDEIVVTEHSYAMYMKAICNIYRKTLQDEMSESDLKVCFSNVEQLMQFTNVFLPELQKAAKAKDEMIGKVYKQFSPFFKMYAAYCGGHAKASQKMEELSSKKKIQKVLDKCQEVPQCKGQNIQSLLIMPIQRVPRHKLLLKELLKHTPEDHPDFQPCQEALEAISVVASHVNDHIRVYQSILKVWEVQRSMRPRPEIFHQGCSFIHSGPLIKKTSRGRELRYFFLFSDCLVYAKELPIIVNNVRYQYRQTVKVAGVIADESQICELNKDKDKEEPRGMSTSTSMRQRKRSMSKSRSSIYRRISVSVAGVGGAIAKAASPDAKSRQSRAASASNAMSTAVEEARVTTPESAPPLPGLRGENEPSASDQVDPQSDDKANIGDQEATTVPSASVPKVEPKQYFPFKVLATKSLVLYASSEAERDIWVKHIEENCDTSVVTDEAKKLGEIHQQEIEEQAILDAQKTKIKVSAPVPLKTVTAWYQLQPRKSSPFRRSSSTTSNPGEAGPEVKVSFHISKTGDDLSRAGPVNSLSLMYLTLTVISAKGLKVADAKRNTSDPYCVVSTGKKKAIRTKTCKGTLEPVWYEQVRDLEFIAGIYSSVQIEVFHEQHWRSDTSLGVVSITMDKMLSLAGISVEDLDASATVITETAKDDKVMQKVKRTSVVDSEFVQYRVHDVKRSGVVEIKPANVALPRPEEQEAGVEVGESSSSSRPLPVPPPLPKPRNHSPKNSPTTSDDDKLLNSTTETQTSQAPENVVETSLIQSGVNKSLAPTQSSASSSRQSSEESSKLGAGATTETASVVSTNKPNGPQNNKAVQEPASAVAKNTVKNPVTNRRTAPPKPPAPKLTKGVKDRINTLAIPRSPSSKNKKAVVPTPQGANFVEPSKVAAAVSVLSASSSSPSAVGASGSSEKASPTANKSELKRRLFRLLAEHGSGE